jgi:hypothetical protein
MSSKQRIKQLERVKINQNTETHMLWDTEEEGTVSYDGVKMSKAEAERLVAALPESALLIHVVYASKAEADNDN